MLYTATGLHALDGFDTSGNRQSAVKDPTNGWGVTLTAGTYYFPLGSDSAGLIVETQDQSISLQWSAALAGTATFEVTNFPASLGGIGTSGGADVTDWAAAGPWQLFNPASASAQAYTSQTGTGNSWTNLTLTLGGSNAGGAFANMPGTTMRRMRMKLVVTTGGFLRVLPWGKIGS